MAPSLTKTLLVGVAALASVESFSPQTLPSTRCSSSSSSQLSFGIPSFFTPQSDKDSAGDTKKTTKKSVSSVPEKKIDLKGILQLITAGAGAPFLGDFEGVDEETGKFMFSLEANNLVDEKGNSKQTQMPHFENGWVDPEDKGFKFPWQK
jgi:hypothetical protein